jgi:predicted dehydrogenase/threonine dehydrogenase-like Zn-dependent dehydrogenase
MRQVTQNYKTGEIKLEQVQQPQLKAGGVLVRTHFSVVSTGTEGMKVREGKLSYLGKARARPDQVKKVLQTLRQQGLRATYEKVMNKLDSLTPLGYSLAGEVIAVGAEAGEFHVGQRVACAGAGYANHAEVNYIPKNLVVPVPANVSLKEAAFATVGAIAMQGFRQGQMQLGETACVIGLGLLGQLLVQILRSAGIHVIGIDLVKERCALAEKLGAHAAMTPEDPGLESAIKRLTGGYGVDCIFIAAGGSSNAATELAVAIARDRATVVDVGKTRLDLPWNDYYMKELNVRFSRSYGPGRYDPMYEERGVDYPIGYVRWTEKRNLSSFLQLIADRKVTVEPIVSAVHPFSEAERIYSEIGQGGGDLLGVVFEYEHERELEQRAAIALPSRAVPRKVSVDRLRIGLIGAGNYASSMLLPHLRQDRQVELVAVATTTGLSAQNAQRKFGFTYATTRHEDILEDPNIDAVVVATRHSSHARLAAQALRSGKATYVEKPLGLSVGDLALVKQAIEESGNDRLLVGFNRRFSPIVQALAQRFGGSRTPLIVHYRVHAGQLEKGSWYLDQTEGTRFAGEAGHFFDVVSYVCGARPATVTASTLRPEMPTADDMENVVATVQFENGSLGTVSYLTQGSAAVPKESIEVFGGGVTAQIENFESLRFFEKDGKVRRVSMPVDKGQKNEMGTFVRCAAGAGAMPITVESLFDTSLTTLAVAESIRSGKPVVLRDLWREVSE